MRALPLLDLGLWPWQLDFEGTLFAWTEDGFDGGRMDLLMERSRGITLTDDYAPVDNMLAPVFAAQAEYEVEELEYVTDEDEGP